MTMFPGCWRSWTAAWARPSTPPSSPAWPARRRGAGVAAEEARTIPPSSEGPRMSTVERRPPGPPRPSPPLAAGQRLGPAEFRSDERRAGPGCRAELIGGEDHVPSPVGRDHGISTADVIGWLVAYRGDTPGTPV